MDLLHLLSSASPGAQALAVAGGSLSPAALAVVLLVVLPRWARVLRQAFRVLAIVGLLLAGFVLWTRWDQIGSTLGF